jgi:ech hydrogenase subunit A
MQLIETLALLTILLPTLGALLAFPAGDKARKWVVLAFAAAIILVGGVMTLMFLYEGKGAVDLGKDSLGVDINAWVWGITALDLALMVFLLYLGARSRSIIAVVAAILQMVIVVGFEAWHGFGEAPAMPFVLDRLALVLVAVCCIIGSLIAVFSIHYMEGRAKKGRFFAFVFLFLGAMNGAVLSNELLWLFFFWEVTTLCSYYLIFHDETPEAKASARLALEITLWGGVALAAGIAYAGWKYGTLEMDKLMGMGDLAGLGLVIPALLVIGGMTKSAQVPFQSWLLGAMVAPTPVSALLHSSTMVNLGVYAIIRMAPLLKLYLPLSYTIALAGGITFAATAGLALTQRNVKRVLAYSTIGNLGLVVMCVGINTPASLVAAVFILLFHAVSKGMLFLSAGVIDHELGTKDIEEMGGLSERMPFVTMIIVLGSVSMMLPPFGLFAGKWLSVEAATQMPMLLLLLGVGSAATVLYYTKWVGRLISRTHATPKPAEPLSMYYKVPLGAIAAGILMLSILTPFFANSFAFNMLPADYASPHGSAAADLLASNSYIWIGAVFLFLAAGLALPIALVAVKDKDKAKVYTCGEDIEPQVAGHYFGGERTETTLTDLAVSVCAGLAIAVMLLPYIAEVF